MYSLIVPIYRSEESIPDLLAAIEDLDARLDRELEVIFVDDGSPDRSCEILESELPKRGLRAQLLTLSRNFGAFAAIREGLAVAEGPYFAVMAADLQEPPELVPLGPGAQGAAASDSWARIDIEVPFKAAKKQMVDEFDRRFMSALLERHDGNISAAARATGVDRMSIYKLLQRLGLDRDDD